MNLDQALKANRGIGPGFHMLRHLLAFLIVAHHCRAAVFGEDTDNLVKGASLSKVISSHVSYGYLLTELLRPALFALVGMFFVLSGFLVFGSAVRNSKTTVFFANRAFRIIPALSVEVTLSALVLGPLVTTLPIAAYFSDPKFFAYFGNIFGHITFFLPGVFETNPWPGTVNANLWTLPPEFWCYFGMLFILSTGFIVHPNKISILIVATFTLCLVLSLSGILPIRAKATHFTSWFIVLMFFVGAALYINAKLVPLHPLLFVAAAIGYYMTMAFNVVGVISGLFLAYCTIYIGFMRFDWFDRLLKIDLSYGTYLYGFPITQTVIFFFMPHLAGRSPTLRYLIIFPVVIALTGLFSTVSWLLIEKPALSLRRYFSQAEPRITTGVAL